MNKQEFKRDYSAYRKLCSSAFYRSYDAFKAAIDSNALFSQCHAHDDRPVGIRSACHIRGI